MNRTTQKLLITLCLLVMAGGANAEEFNIKPACEVPASKVPVAVKQSGDTENPIYDEPLETGHKHWERERAEASRDREMAVLSQASLNKGLPTASYHIKEDFINAKLHVAYAATAQLTKDDPQQAATELKTAAKLLNKALKMSGPKASPQIKAAMDQVNSTEKLVIPCHGQSKWQEGHAYEHLESMLRHMIKSKLTAS